jgi:NagD protein
MLEDRLARAEGLLFDLDGTLALGDRDSEGYRALPGALELLERIAADGRPFAIFTNGTHHTPRAYVEMLRRAGFSIDERAMLTPAVVAADFFARKKFERVLVLGVEGVSQPIVDAGVEVVRPGGDDERADATFVGWHPAFALRDIDAACRVAWAGGGLYTASSAPFFATRSGKAIGVSGAICAAIHSVTRQRVNVLGKPSLAALRMAARRLGVRPDRLLVVGDDPLLEVAMARAGGASAVGVLSGLATAESFANLPPEREAHFVANGVADLLPFFGKRQ